MIWNQVAYMGDPNYVNLRVISFQDADGDSLLNFTFTTNVTILKFISTLTLFIPSAANVNEFEHKVLQSSSDHCKIHNELRGTWSHLLDDFEHKSDFEFKCTMEAK